MTTKTVARIIIEVLELEDYTPENFPTDVLLFDESGMGFDSIAALEIIAGLSAKFDLPFDDIERLDMANVDSLVAYVERNQALAQES